MDGNLLRPTGGAVLRVEGRVKKKWRDEADNALAWGIVGGCKGAIGWESYEHWVAFWLLIPRSFYRQGHQFLMALQAHFGAEDVPEEWFDAVIDIAVKARYRRFMVNSGKKMRRLAGGRGGKEAPWG